MAVSRRHTLALLIALLSAWVSAPRAQTRQLLTLNDLDWQGEYGVPASNIACGDGIPRGGDQAGMSSGPMAVRYVSGSRRYLMMTGNCTYTSGRTFGDLVEYRDPTSVECPGGLYRATGDPTLACSLRETKRWANITNFDSWDLALRDTASGNVISSLYWDETNQVIWGIIVGAYSSTNSPFLFATSLLNTAETGAPGYFNVGTKYGPYYYRSGLAGDLHTEWKAVNGWIVPIPSDQQTALGNKRVVIGGFVGAVGGSRHSVPGFRAFANLTLLLSAPPCQPA